MSYQYSDAPLVRPRQKSARVRGCRPRGVSARPRPESVPAHDELRDLWEERAQERLERCYRRCAED